MSDGSCEHRRRPDRAALCIALALAVIGAVVIYDTASIRTTGPGYAGIGPRDVPRLVGGALIALGLWTAIAAFREQQAEPRPKQDLPPVLWIVAGLAGQLLLIGTLGFSLATGLLFACTARAFGRRAFVVTLPVGIVLSLLIYGVFAGPLRLSLPAGPLEALIFGG